MPDIRTERRDAFTWLSEVPDASVDMVFTDPPYESLEKHRKMGTTTRLKHSTQSSNDWFGVIENARLPDLMREFYRVLKKDRHCYVMCDPETMFVLKPAGEQAGFKFWKPVIWDKMKIGMGYHYRARYECVLFFEKGKRRLQDLGTADVLQVPRIKGADAYPTEKPVELVSTFVAQSSFPGELIIDPFLGSGTTAVVALAAGRAFAGCDISAEAVGRSRERIAAARLAQGE